MRSLRVAAAAAAATTAVALLAGCGSSDDNIAGETVRTTPDPATPPTGVRWEPFESIALPFAAEGPTDRPASGAVAGFTHTPPGAALAAIQQTVRISVAPDTQWPQVVRAGVAPGPQRDAFSVHRAQISITTPPEVDQAPRITGYTVTDYTDTTANVEVYTVLPDQSSQINDVSVVWSSGDWKLRLPAEDDPATRVRAIADSPSTPAVALASPHQP